MTNKLKRLGFFGLVVLLLAIQLITPFGNSRKVSAEPTDRTADSVARLEYKHWKAAKVLAGCTDDNFANAGVTMDNSGYDGKNGNVWGAGGGVNMGELFSKVGDVPIDNNDANCENSAVKPALAKALGYGSLIELEEDIWPRKLNGNPPGVQEKGRWVMRKEVKDLLPAYPYGNHDDVKKGLFSWFVRHAGQGEDKADGLSDAAKFWYWNQVMAFDTKSGGCGGKFLTDSAADKQAYALKDDDRKDPASRWNKDHGFYGVDANGEPVEYPYVVYNKSETDNLTGLDNQVPNPNTGAPECKEISQWWLSNGDMKTWRDAYVKLWASLKTAAEQQISDQRDKDIKACVARGGTPTQCTADANASAQAASDAYTAAQAGGPLDTSSKNIAFKCEIKLTSPITWFMCPLIDGFTESINQLDGAITDQLTIKTNDYFKGTNGDAFRGVWASMRTIAISFLVIIGLIMVIGTALGVGVFDAYTVKKLFPRIMIAIVGISISWPLVIFMIEASNSLGVGIRSLIQAPFAAQFAQGVSVNGGELTLGALGVVGLGLALGILGILSLVATAFVAVVIAFMTLVFRTLIVILLAVVAPVAIAAYILPNTQKYGKAWWEFFSKALLVFPIISAMIAVGRVFAVVSQQAGGGADMLHTVIGFIAYFGPYFVLPKAFAMAGGAIGNLSGMVNNRGKGAFDRLRNFRGNKAKQNWSDTRSGNRFRGANKETRSGRLRGRLNDALETGARANELGFNPTRWGTKSKVALRDAAESHVEDAVKEISSWSGDDEKVWAAKGQTREDIAKRLMERDPGRFGKGHENERDEAVEQIMNSKRALGDHAFHRARIRAQAKTGTGYIDEHGNFDASKMIEDINESYGDDRNGAGKALAEMRGVLANSGQVAGLAGYGTWAEQMQKMYDKPNDEETALGAHNAIMADTINSVAPGQALYGKPSSAAAIGKAHATRLKELAASINDPSKLITDIDPNTGRPKKDASGKVIQRQATREDLDAAMANAAGIYDAMAQASPNNANAMAEELMGAAIDGPTLTRSVTKEKWANGKRQQNPDGSPAFEIVQEEYKPESVREYITSQMESSSGFVNRRRDFSAATWQQGQQAQAAAAAAAGGGLGGGLGGTSPGGTPFS